MINWKFYSKRKGIDLASFLKDTSTYADALALFKTKEIEVPDNLREFYKNKSTPVADLKPTTDVLEKKPVVKKPATRTPVKKPAAVKKKPASKTRKRRSSVNKKEPVSSNLVLDETIEDKAENEEKKPYFRKIIKPEKK